MSRLFAFIKAFTVMSIGVLSSASLSASELFLHNSDVFSWDGASKHNPEAVVAYTSRHRYNPQFLLAIKKEENWQALYLRYFAWASHIEDLNTKRRTLDGLVDWLGDNVIEISLYLDKQQISPDWIDKLSPSKKMRMNVFTRLKPTYDVLTFPERHAVDEFIRNQPRLAERFIDCNRIMWDCSTAAEKNQIITFLVTAKSELLVARFMWEMNGYHDRVVQDLIQGAPNNWEELFLSLMRVSSHETVKSLFNALGEYTFSFCAYLHLTSPMQSLLREKMERLRDEYITAPVKLKSRLVLLSLSESTNISKWAKNLIEQVHQGHTFDACANFWVNDYFSDERSHGEFLQSRTVEIYSSDKEILYSRRGQTGFLYKRVVDFVVAKLEAINSASQNMDPLHRARKFLWVLKTDQERRQYLQNYDEAAILLWKQALSHVASESFMRLFDEALSAMDTT